VGLDPFHVLLQQTSRLPELLALRTIGPLSGGAAGVLGLGSVKFGQCPSVTARGLGHRGQSLALAATLQGCAGGGNRIPSDLLRALVLSNPAFRCVDLGDPPGVVRDDSLLIRASLLPVTPKSRVVPWRRRPARRSRAGDQQKKKARQYAAMHRGPYFTLLIRVCIASSRAASSLSWWPRLSDRRWMVSASFADVVVNSWLAAPTFRRPLAFSTVSS
jgi:hypothetical protein